MIPDKSCAWCGERIVYASCIGPLKFAAMRYCSKTCSNRGRVAQRQAPEPKPCEWCQRPIPWKGEKPSKYARRKYCSTACTSKGIAAKNRIERHKNCKRCGGEFQPRPTESGQQWERRIYCSIRCSARDRHFLRRYPSQRPKIPQIANPTFESSEEWLRHHQPQVCPTRYVAPVQGAGL